MTKALCIQNVKGMSESQLLDIVRKSSGRMEPKLEDVFYNAEQGKVFFEYDTDNLASVENIQMELGLPRCETLIPVKEIKPLP